MKIKDFKHTKLNTRVEVNRVIHLVPNWNLNWSLKRSELGSLIGRIKEFQLEYVR